MSGALITGASRGIGRATAERFAKANIPVCVTARPSEDLQRTLSALLTEGAKAFAIEADITKPEEIASVVAKAEEILGGVDFLVNNAGIAPKMPIQQTSLDTWYEVLHTNLTAAFCFAKEVVPHMISRKRGRLVFVSSISATRPFGGFSAYAASKAGMIGMARSLAEELKPYNIQSLVVAPGSVDTQLLTRANPGLVADMSPEEVAEAIFFAATGPKAINGSTIDIFG